MLNMDTHIKHFGSKSVKKKQKKTLKNSADKNKLVLPPVAVSNVYYHDIWMQQIVKKTKTNLTQKNEPNTAQPWT